MSKHMPALVQIALYFDPLDYPGKWVVRKWFTMGTHLQAERTCKVFDKRPSAKDAGAEEFLFLPRFPGDDRAIVGVWI